MRNVWIVYEDDGSDLEVRGVFADEASALRCQQRRASWSDSPVAVVGYEVPWTLQGVSSAHYPKATMPIQEIWIVFHDSGPDDKIIAVLNDEEEALVLWEGIGSSHKHGALLAHIEVPWQAPDPTRINIP